MIGHKKVFVNVVVFFNGVIISEIYVVLLTCLEMY